MSYSINTIVPTLYVCEAEGGYRAASDDEILSVARATITAQFRRGLHLNQPSVVRSFLVQHFAQELSEVFVAIFLDGQHRVIEIVELGRGTIDAAPVYPREVVKAALRHNAAATIFAHQHPSGVAEPSSADRMLTERLKQALALIDVRVLDHIVVGGTETVSFAEKGWI